jgi:hypothetical protein
MVTSSHLPTLLTQFQSRYPLGCLLTELLTIHQGQFVVRALVQSAGATIATAMAAAAEIEMAEDRAKLRALEAIGITANLGLGSAHAATSSVLPNPEPNPNLPLSKPTFPQFDAELSPPAAPNPPEPELPLQPIATSTATKALSQTAELTELPYSPPAPPKAASLTSSSVESGAFESSSLNSLAFDAELPTFTKSTAQSTVQSMAASPAFAPDDFSTESFTVEAEPPVAVPAATGRTKSEKSPKRKAEASEPVTAIHPTANPPANPADRSEEIMKIGIEMKRLGWSTEQGREYLKRTYGKRSRQELDDAELLDFLHYLETQPSPLQTPF